MALLIASAIWVTGFHFSMITTRQSQIIPIHDIITYVMEIID